MRNSTPCLLGTNGSRVQAENERFFLLLRTAFVVETSNMKISRRHLADYVKNVCQKGCRMCSAIIFPPLTNQIMVSGVVVSVAVVIS